MFISDFEIVRPRFESNQQQTLDWLIDAHTKAERRESYRSEIEERLLQVACKPDRIGKRGHVLSDFLHTEWEKMEIYSLEESPQGKDLSTRMKRFQEEVDPIFERYYPETAVAPDDLIHVSCTGYVSPSGAQKLVSRRGWNTTVTHAYHMGCYGALPALRMGSGFLKSGSRQVDIVHTELCSLHSNPKNHASDQLVSQSLFADGFIKYSIKKEFQNPALKIEKIQEEIIPDSRGAMTWNIGEWGFQMSLAKEIPVRIARHLKGYLERLGEIPSNALFAIHPGGPKILTQIQDLLGLREEQLAFSFAILKEYGNMSSATLPHIWERILNDPTVPHATSIVSLAFGPGLTIAGAKLEKVCGF